MQTARAVWVRIAVWLTAARTIIRLHRTERVAGLLNKAEPLILVACDTMLTD